MGNSEIYLPKWLVVTIGITTFAVNKELQHLLQ